MSKTIRVVATNRGFDGISIREIGEEFTMPADVMTAKKEETKTPEGKGTGHMVTVPPTWFKPVGSAAREVGDDDSALA